MAHTPKSGRRAGGLLLALALAAAALCAAPRGAAACRVVSVGEPIVNGDTPFSGNLDSEAYDEVRRWGRACAWGCLLAGAGRAAPCGQGVLGTGREGRPLQRSHAHVCLCAASLWLRPPPTLKPTTTTTQRLNHTLKTTGQGQGPLHRRGRARLPAHVADAPAHVVRRLALGGAGVRHARRRHRRADGRRDDLPAPDGCVSVCVRGHAVCGLRLLGSRRALAPSPFALCTLHPPPPPLHPALALNHAPASPNNRPQRNRPPPSPRRPPKGLSFSQTLVDGVVREFLDSRYVSKARPFYFHTGDDKLRDVYSAINTEFNKDYARLPDVAPANAEERNTWLDELSKVSGRRRSVCACASAARARALTSAQSVPAVRRTPAFCYLLPACCLGLFHPAQSGRC